MTLLDTRDGARKLADVNPDMLFDEIERLRFRLDYTAKRLEIAVGLIEASRAAVGVLETMCQELKHEVGAATAGDLLKEIEASGLLAKGAG